MPKRAARACVTEAMASGGGGSAAAGTELSRGAVASKLIVNIRFWRLDLKQIGSATAYDPGLAIWVQGKDNAAYWENVIGYLNPGVYAYDRYGEGAIDRFQIYSAVNLSFQETPKALAWIAQHYRIDLSEAMQQL